MAGIVRTLFTVIVGILAFIVWVYMWSPLTVKILFPLLTNEANVPNGMIIIALLSLLPLVMAGLILISPFMDFGNQGQQY